MATNWKNVHEAIKSPINSKGFKYVPSNQWFNLELGIFPKGRLQNSYAIRYTDLSGSSSESDSFSEIGVAVEFALNSTNDKYLEKIGTMNEAIKSLINVSHNDINVLAIDKSFVTNYVEDLVVVTYSQIKIEIKD